MIFLVSNPEEFEDLERKALSLGYQKIDTTQFRVIYHSETEIELSLVPLWWDRVDELIKTQLEEFFLGGIKS